MPSHESRVIDAIALAVNGMGLMDEEDNPANVVKKDRATVFRLDQLPMIMITPAGDHSDDLYAFSRVGKVYPGQITLVDSSNRSQNEGRGLLDQWKDTIWTKFKETQPYVLRAYLADLYSNDIKAGQPLNPAAWDKNYNVKILFVYVELIENLAYTVTDQ